MYNCTTNEDGSVTVVMNYGDGQTRTDLVTLAMIEEQKETNRILAAALASATETYQIGCGPDARFVTREEFYATPFSAPDDSEDPWWVVGEVTA